jgi:UDP-glucose 4-epimerase
VRLVIIGGCGYIGSKLHAFFNVHRPNHAIDVVDEASQNRIRYQQLSQNYLSDFDAVIWLAGHSSVSQAITDPVGALRNNLVDLYEFGRLLRPEQVFIYASSASVYNRTDSSRARETDELHTPLNAYDLSKKWFDEISPKLTSQTYGLRFGTVSGMSPNMRLDLIVNSMVNSGIKNSYISVKNETNWRSILGIEDLVTAIDVIINERPETGIYNVASESATIGEIGSRISRVLGVPLGFESGEGTYNFQISTSKLEEHTTWRPTQTIEMISESIYKGLTK